MKWLLGLALLSVPVLADDSIRYELSFPNAAHHEVEVRATFPVVRQRVLEVLMSRSSPGRYALHEFAKNVDSLRASDGHGRPLRVDRASPFQWNISGHKGTVVVEYTVYGDRIDGTYAAIDVTHAHLNLPAVLVWAHGMERRPVAIKLEAPANSGWKVATQLAPGPDGTWTAPNLDRMMDGSIEFSAYDLLQWTVGGTQFRMALHHKGTQEDAESFARQARAMTIEAEGVFGAFPKYDNGNYTFLLDYLPFAMNDGMEHRNSTVISGIGTLATNASQMIGTLSHEFFHSWNVKRIRPKALEPFDFERINQSGELWFAEGFTNYYGGLILLRAGLTSQDNFLASAGAAVSNVLTSPGRETHSVAEMSRLSPFHDGVSYRDPTNTANTYISYYVYGEALALGIDLSIRETFPGRSLDDWMREMWKQHPDANRPYTPEDLERALASVTSREFAAGIFRRHIYGKEPMPYRDLLARAGLSLESSAPESTWLGVTDLNFSDRGGEIAGTTLRGSPAYQAGLDRGDRLIALNGEPLTSQKQLDTFLQSHTPGDHVKVKAQTRSGEKELDLVLEAAPGLQLLRNDRELTPAMQALRSQWWSSKAVHPR